MAITARDDEEARRLAEGGVDLVLYPYDDAATSAAKHITDLDEESATKAAKTALAAAALEGRARVAIVGCDRVGDLLGEMLTRHHVSYVALDRDAALVARERRRGKPIFNGDATGPELLRHCRLACARGLVVTMDGPVAVESVVTAVRAEGPDLIIGARVGDAEHAAKLYGRNITDAVPETIEASLQLSETLLVNIGVPMGLVIASIHEKRDEFRRARQAPESEGRLRRAIRTSTRAKSDGGA